jgi:hypothetical protein
MLQKHGILELGSTTPALFRCGHRNREADPGGKVQVTRLAAFAQPPDPARFSKEPIVSVNVGDDLVPTEGWGDRSQNCLHDVRIVGNT